MLHRVWSFCCVFSLWIISFTIQANGPVELLKLGDQLFDNGYYDAAITEYLRYQFFHPQADEIFYTDYKIGMSLDKSGRYDAAALWLRQSLGRPNSEKFRPIIRYRLALVLHSAGQLDGSRIELFKLLNSNPPDSILTAARTIFVIVSVQGSDWQMAEQTLAAMAFANDDNNLYPKTHLQLEKLAVKPAVKSLKIAKWLSTFVPGSGQIYAGEFLNGFNALAINIGTSYLLYHEIQEEDFSDAGLLFALLWLRFYNGNRYQAEQAANRANLDYQKKEMEAISRLLRSGLAEQGDVKLEIHLQQILQKQILQSQDD